MAQVIDFNIAANPSGLNMRTELNGIIEAILTQNSGTDEPLNQFSGMEWVDKSDVNFYYIKKRNLTNDGWDITYIYDVVNNKLNPFGDIAYTIETVNDFINIPLEYKTAIVKDINRGGTFIWSATGTANGGTVFAGVSGYWNRQYSGAVNVKWFGANGDTILSGNAVVSGNDDTSAFINAFLASLNVYIPIGNYRITNTIVIPIKGTLTGQDKDYSCIIADPLTDIDCLVVGWYSTLDNFKMKSTYLGDAIGAGSKGLIRLQNTTYSEIPTVNGIDLKLHGGLSYKNTLKNLVLERGQNYNIYGVNVGYTNIENVRSVLARNESGSLHITGTNDGTAIIGSTTVNIKGGEYTASYKGNGITFNESYTCHIDESIVEGNYSRGLLFTNTSNMFMDNIYVENNFALGSTIGDGDIVVTGSTRVSIKNSFIYSNNSNASLSSSGCSKCSLSNTEYTNGLVPWVLNVNRKEWTIARQDNGIYDYGEYTLTQANGTFENIGYWVKYADGTAIFTKRITLAARNIATAQGNIFIQGTSEVDTDYPTNLFRINADLSHEFCASILSMYGSGGNAIWAVSNGASTLNNALRYRLASNVTLSGINIPLHITMTGRWR